VANARRVRLIGESRKKDDRLDAQTLARLARIDPRPICTERNQSLLESADGSMATVATRREKKLVQRKNNGTYSTPTGLLMEAITRLDPEDP
jgi:hypothetical protein